MMPASVLMAVSVYDRASDSMCPRFFGSCRSSCFVSIRYNPHRRWQTNQVEAELALKADCGSVTPSLHNSTFHRAWGASCRVVGALPDKLNLNGHGRSSISNGALDAHHDADHRSRLGPARPGKCAPGGPSQSSAAKQSPGRATHRPAVPRSAPQAPQAQSPQPQGPQYSSNEIIGAGHRFFGTISRGLAQIVEKAGSQFGLPNGYVLGQEGGGAVVAGLRYGEGILYTKNAGDLRVFWQGPSLGYDFGVDGARTMMLIYNLPATDATAISNSRRRRPGTRSELDMNSRRFTRSPRRRGRSGSAAR